jgi:hypothetical protein
MRLPKRDGSYAASDDEIYDDVPATKRMKHHELLELVNHVIDGNEADGILIAGALAKDWDRVSPKVYDAYVREAQRISGILSTSLGAPVISKVEEVGFVGYRWTVRGVPVVLAPYQEDSDLPLELFLTRVTAATKIYLAPSLTRAAPKPRVEKKITPKPRAVKKASKKLRTLPKKSPSKRTR